MKPIRVFEVTGAKNVNGNAKYAQVMFSTAMDYISWRFDGTTKMDRWLVQPPALALLYRRRKPADFLDCIAPGAFAAVHPIRDDIARTLRVSGELLPAVTAEGLELSIVNVGPGYPCLDLENTVGPRFRDGGLMYAEQLAFFEQRLPRQSLFMAEECTGVVFALERDDIDPRDSFKVAVEDANLKGLDFCEVWNSVDGAVVRRGLFGNSPLFGNRAD